MTRKTFSISALFLAALLFSGPANAQTVVIGETCTTPGVTTMTPDEKNIAACLKPNSGSGHVWKSMTAEGGSTGAHCGLSVVTKVTSITYNDRGTASSSYSYSSGHIAQCEGKNVVNVSISVNPYNGKQNAPVVTNNCPSGYQVASFSSLSSSSESGSSLQNYYLCVKK